MKLHLPQALRKALLIAMLLSSFPNAVGGGIYNGTELTYDIWKSSITGDTVLTSWREIVLDSSTTVNANDLTISDSGEITFNPASFYTAGYLTISNSGEIVFNTDCDIGEGATFENNYGSITFENSSTGIYFAVPINGEDLKKGLNFINNQSTITFSEHTAGAIYLAITWNGYPGDVNFRGNQGTITFSNNSNSVSEDAPYPSSTHHSTAGAIYNMSGDIDFEKNQGDIIFSQNSVSSCSVYWLAGAAICGEANINFTENGGNIVFSGNEIVTKNKSGIITANDSITFSDNLGDIIFKDNIGGSVIFSDWGNIHFSQNEGDIRFSGNTGSHLISAIEHYYATGERINFSANKQNIIFSNNSSDGDLFNYFDTATFAENLEDITFSYNTSGEDFFGVNAVFTENLGDITFSNNSSSARFIGAHLNFEGNQGTINFSNNSSGENFFDSSATFSENLGGITFSYNTPGENFFNYDTTFTKNLGDINFSYNTPGENFFGTSATFTENLGDITFSNNSSSARFIEAHLNFEGNQGTITFSNNSFEEDFFYFAEFKENQGDIIFSNNFGRLSFQSITGNQSVTFRGNYIKQYAEDGTTLTGAVLRGSKRYTHDTFNLSTRADGGTITFYDPIESVKYGGDQYLNSYRDSGDNTVTGTGAITLSGKHAQEDLEAIFDKLGLDKTGDNFQNCLKESLTSTIKAGSQVCLAGGSLNVTDGAILNTGYGYLNQYVAKAGSTTKITNGGVMNIGSTNFKRDGDSYASLIIDNGIMSVDGTFTSSGYTKINNGTLKISNASSLENGGWVELQKDSTVTVTGKFTVNNDSSLEITGADTTLTAQNIVFTTGSNLTLYSSGSGTLTATNVTMTGTALDIYSGSNADQYDITVDGNLTLNACTINLYGSGIDGKKGNAFSSLSGIDVTGKLTVGDTTTINLEEAAVNGTNQDANLTLFRTNSSDDFSGDYTAWTLQSFLTNADNTITYTTLENAELTEALMDGGKWGVILKLTGTGGSDQPLPPIEDDDDIYVTPGENKSITDLTKKVHIMGGTLDATGVSTDTPLNNDVIVEGTDGTLIMTTDQTLNLAGNLTGDNAVGYDVEGQDGGSAGTIGTGTAGGCLNSTSVDLSGENYNINALDARSGITTIDENTNLGHDDTKITVGTTDNDTTNAILVNEGTITGDSLTVKADGSVTNNNTINITNDISLNNGSGLLNTADADLTAENITVAENATLTNSGTITTTDANISGDVINGGTASADHIQLNGGATLTNLKDATITTTDDIQVSQDAMLTNNGTITGDINLTGTMTNNGNNSGDITVGDGGLLTGGGTFGRVNVQNGGMLNIQGAPSFTGLTFDDNSGISFTVNGITPYSTGLSAQETYSRATVGTLTMNSVPSITVNIGAGLIAAGSVDFTLDLLKTTELLGDAVGSITEETLNEQLKLAGMTNLLEDGSTLTWDAESGTLSFSGTVSLASSTGLARQDAALLADTLWSGVSSVASFARTAAEQGKMAGCRSSRLWGAGLGYFTSMSAADSLSGFSYKGGGYAVGGDVALNKTTVVGASFGQMFGTHKSDNSMLSDKQRSFMFALYGNHCQEVAQNQTLTLSGYFSYGNIDHSANTHVGGTTPGHADWDDHAYAFGLLANWDIAVSDKLTVSPYTGLTYMYGTQGTIEETFNGGKRYLGNGSLQTWSIPVGVTLKSVCSLSNGQALLPELSIAYVGDIARRNPYTRTWANGQAVTGKGHNPGRNALMTRAGLGWQINKNWQAGAYYTLEVRSGQTNQSVNLNASYSF